MIANLEMKSRHLRLSSRKKSHFSVLKVILGMWNDLDEQQKNGFIHEVCMLLNNVIESQDKSSNSVNSKILLKLLFREPNFYNYAVTIDFFELTLLKLADFMSSQNQEVKMASAKNFLSICEHGSDIMIRTG